MKFETLSEFKSDVTLGAGATSTFTFTFINNIDHIECLFFHPAGGNSTYRNYGGVAITSHTATNNVLAVVVTNQYGSSAVFDLFMLATVASY